MRIIEKFVGSQNLDDDFLVEVSLTRPSGYGDRILVEIDGHKKEFMPEQVGTLIGMLEALLRRAK